MELRIREIGLALAIVGLVALVGCETDRECTFNSDCPADNFCDGGSCQVISENNDDPTPDPQPMPDAGMEDGGEPDAGPEADVDGEPDAAPDCVPSDEVCDGIDNDCDGIADNPVATLTDNCDTSDNAEVACLDGQCVASCGAGFVDVDGDLGEEGSNGCECVVEPEVCDGLDNDCDGGVDGEDGDLSLDDCPGVFGAIATGCGQGRCVYACESGLVDLDGDLQDEGSNGCECDPEAVQGELCDGLDNDCDGIVDNSDAEDLLGECPLVINAVSVACSDGRCQYACEEGAVDDNGDLNLDGGDGCERVCTDEEVACDGIDDDCDGVVDEGCDDDNDGFCDAEFEEGDAPPAACPNGFGDCDDAVFDTKPGADEICDDVDNNCVDGTDEGCDDDGDGHCDVNVANNGVLGLTCTEGFEDCLDDRPDIFPGQIELCDGEDNNCNGDIDADDLLYDEPCDDQFGVCEGAQKRCVGGVPLPCDDAQYTAHNPDFRRDPLFGELLCDGLDNDCDGEADEACGVEACEDDRIERITGDVDTIHPAVAAGPDSLFVLAWIEQDGGAERLTVALYDARTDALLRAPTQIQDEAVRHRWPVALYHEERGEFRIFYVGLTELGFHQLSTVTISTTGTVRNPFVTREHPNTFEKYGPLDAIAIGNNFAVINATIDSINNTSEATIYEGNGANMTPTLPGLPNRGLSTQFETGRADLSLVSHPDFGLYFVTEGFTQGFEEDILSVRISRVDVPSVSQSSVSRLNDETEGVVWPRMGKHDPTDRVSFVYFRLGGSSFNTLERVRYADPEILGTVRDQRLRIPIDPAPDNLHYLTAPNSERWLAVWRQGGNLMGFTGDETGFVFQGPATELAPIDAPTETHTIAIDPKLRAGNLAVLGRQDTTAGLDLVWLNASGERICRDPTPR